jgi:acetylornithine deacetylase/succinyl-diaminopimelate desuccinylase-like protein
MDSDARNALTRRNFLHTSLTGAAALALGGPEGLLAQTDRESVVAQVARQHDATVQRLRDWIALPSIAAENLNYPQGAEYMARLARDAGFGHVAVVQTAGKPGVFATLDAGAATTLALYFMYDVKQFDASEWSAPPLEGRIIDRPGVGKIMIGRGATNTKGPQVACLAALHAFKAAGRTPPVNLVLVCEGEEEIGSPHFRDIVFKPDVEAALRKSVGIVIPLGNQALDGSVQVNLGSKGVIEL